VKSGSSGIWVQSSHDAVIKGNTITDNEDNGIHIYLGSSGTVNNNNITGNGIGLNSAVATRIDATNNWWGPGGAGDNAGKPGEDGNNGVTGNVDFTPWAKTKF